MVIVYLIISKLIYFEYFIIYYILRLNYYRFGSVGQDTSLCLWDFTEDLVKSHLRKLGKKKEEQNNIQLNEVSVAKDTASSNNNAVPNHSASTSSTDKHSSSSSLSYKLANLNFGPISGKDSAGHKRAFSLPSRSEKKENNVRVGGSLTKSSVQHFQVQKFIC